MLSAHDPTWYPAKRRHARQARTQRLMNPGSPIGTIALVGGVAGATFLLARALSRAHEKKVSIPPVPDPMGPPPQPIIVGDPKNPEVASLLAEMDDLFTSMGIPRAYVTAREVTELPEAPGRPSAIPPRPYWPRMGYTLLYGFLPIRIAMGVPLLLRGYRPPWYNDSVGGEGYVAGESRGSSHMYFEGVDARAPEHRRELALVTARWFIQDGSRLRAGFGAYGYPIPSNVHIDTGYDERTWREADRYIADIRQAA